MWILSYNAPWIMEGLEALLSAKNRLVHGTCVLPQGYRLNIVLEEAIIEEFKPPEPGVSERYPKHFNHRSWTMRLLA
jgi:hypothetical protein